MTFAAPDVFSPFSISFFIKALDNLLGMLYNTIVFRGIAQLVEYWSPKPWVVGSSPSAPAKKSAFERMRIFLSKPQVWHIIAARSVVHIIKGALRPCISSTPLGLDFPAA